MIDQSPVIPDLKQLAVEILQQHQHDFVREITNIITTQPVFEQVAPEFSSAEFATSLGIKVLQAISGEIDSISLVHFFRERFRITEQASFQVNIAFSVVQQAIIAQTIPFFKDSPERIPEVIRQINTFFLFLQSKTWQLIGETLISPEQRFTEDIIRNSIDGILAFDRNFIYTEWNPAMEELTGMKREDVVGKQAFEVFPYLMETGENQYYERVLLGERLMIPENRFEIRNTNKRGYYNATYTPIINKNGTVVGGLAVIHEITLRKLVEDKLKEQKEFSESLINNSIDGIIAFNQKMSCTAWNPQMEGFTGIVKEDVLGKKITEVFYNSERIVLQEHLNKVLQGEIIYLENKKFMDSDEFFEVYMVPVYNEEKEISGGLCIVHNITERKKSEEALRELSESLKHTVEGISLLDQDGRYISVNKAKALLLGYEIKAMKGMHWLHVIHPDDHEIAMNAYDKMLSSGNATFEARGSRKDGSWFFKEVTMVANIDREGKFKGHHSFMRDITQRKAVEFRLKRSEAQLIEAQELAKLGNWEYDLVTEELDWSDEMYRLFGLRPKEVKPDYGLWLSLLPEDSASVIISTIEKIKRTYKPSNFEHRILLPNGREKIVYGQGKPVFNDEGEIIKLTGYLQDITDRKDSEKILKEAYEELKKAEEYLIRINSQLEKRVKDRTEELSIKNEELRLKNSELIKINTDLDNFIYTASHDLRAPISNIEGLLLALSEELEPIRNEQCDNLVHMMMHSVNKFKVTIKDLTEITKIQKSIDHEPEIVNLYELVDEVKYDINDLLVKNDAQICVDFEADVINFSKKNLRSILYNLLSNAVKYRSPKRSPQIHMHSRREDGFLVLTIADNGLGFENTQKDKIFRMFKRMHNHVDGTGIGLYIVKRVAENCGGKVEVETELDKGTEFKIFLKEG